MFSMLSDSNATAVKLSLDIMKELYGRDVWKDTKTVNAISTACFSPITKASWMWFFESFFYQKKGGVVRGVKKDVFFTMISAYHLAILMFESRWPPKTTFFFPLDEHKSYLVVNIESLNTASSSHRSWSRLWPFSWGKKRMTRKTATTATTMMERRRTNSRSVTCNFFIVMAHWHGPLMARETAFFGSGGCPVNDFRTVGLQDRVDNLKTITP